MILLSDQQESTEARIDGCEDFAHSVADVALELLNSYSYTNHGIKTFDAIVGSLTVIRSFLAEPADDFTSELQLYRALQDFAADFQAPEAPKSRNPFGRRKRAKEEKDRLAALSTMTLILSMARMYLSPESQQILVENSTLQADVDRFRAQIQTSLLEARDFDEFRTL